MDTLTVFHYHFLTGGITQVVTHSLSALLSSQVDPQVSRLRLVCGLEENAEGVREKIRSAAAAAGRKEIAVEYRVMPELRYISEMEDPPEPQAIENLLLEHFSGDIWWIHNYHLGKNPPFTEAILRIAENHPSQRMVFHIHDFPESGRFDNLELLYKQVTPPWYPLTGNIRYAVINGRDYSILQQAGIPNTRLFLLDNPVFPENSVKTPSEEAAVQENSEEAGSTAGIIRDYCSATSAAWEEGGKLALYPIRTIRRKNVLEAGLIARLLPQPINLLVTLPGPSAQQVAYSNFVGECFEEGLIPGAWPVGTLLDDMGIDFSELTGSADLVISSSIQEGFGYLFLNALQWRVPLLSRDLDILDGMRSVFEGYPAHFYSRILVPVTKSGRESLLEGYKTKVLPLLRRVLSHSEVERIESEITEVCGEELIDFSYLSPELQKTVLQRLSNPSYSSEVEEANAETIRALSETMEERSIDKSGEIAERFGPEAHAKTVREILASFELSPQRSGEDESSTKRRAVSTVSEIDPPEIEGEWGGEVHRRVLSHFLRIEYMRLLYF